ncbi:hypothetical protein AURDEDRAFT_56788 [Auricularia subglabra TFB-10046 SS5]|nr:hypothetical protein AURDEDRAFT_56788 [Auricularia subglabra TFB-10046 SS5]
MLDANAEKDWEALSYVLCHLPAQLSNKHFFCGPKTKKATAELLKALCTAIRLDWYGAHLPPGSGLKARDANAVAYHILAVLVSYKLSFDDRGPLDALVETFVLGLVPHSPTAKPCLDALSLCVFELEASMMRLLSRIIDKLAQIMSNTAMAVHILDFLGFVASRPQLFANFTQDEYKVVFGVTLQYLQVHNHDDEDEAVGGPQGRSWSLSQHVLIYSYYVLYLWFLALPIASRRLHITFITRQLLLANESKSELDERTEVCFDWLMRYTYASADPKPGQSFLHEHVMAPPGARVVEKTWLFPTSLLTIRAVDSSGWVELDARRASGRTCALMRLENVPLAGLGEFEPDMLSEVAFLMRDRDPEAMKPAIFPGDMPTQEAAEVVRYVWAGSAPSQRRKDVTIDPGYIALQISPYPEIWPSTRNVTDAEGLERLCRVLDLTPVIDTHAIGILYVAPGQSDEIDILSNQHGSPAYTRFLAGIGRLIRIDGQRDVYAGSLRAEDDGEYAYAWWDDIGQILYHTATLMPNHEWDQQRAFKKRHVGNDAVRIVWNDSGLPYRFKTLSTEFQFVNIVIEPHSRGTHEYFKLTVQRAHDLPIFDPVGEYKIIRAESLPLYVRQLGLLASFLSRVFIETDRDKKKTEFVTNWRRRLQTIKNFRSRLPPLELPERQPGLLGEQAKRDFTLSC